MKKRESIGAVIGCIVGCLITGVAIYFTHSAFCAVIPLVCFLLGQKIGKKFDR